PQRVQGTPERARFRGPARLRAVTGGGGTAGAELHLQRPRGRRTELGAPAVRAHRRRRVHARHILAVPLHRRIVGGARVPRGDRPGHGGAPVGGLLQHVPHAVRAGQLTEQVRVGDVTEAGGHQATSRRSASTWCTPPPGAGQRPTFPMTCIVVPHASTRSVSRKSMSMPRGVYSRLPVTVTCRSSVSSVDPPFGCTFTPDTGIRVAAAPQSSCSLP